ncbi:hypothetical protein C5167_029537 [Papaver somniferum]|uniref:Uncharacterized protein n=1 Tax=Papaver somniferum TaxID=3469 RepID=A0A4Y7LC45_PAPSO|nr:hypothetical protein C5167_044659 [Papaver somniferum]RZC89403.1 hypothetical protein C5167_030343 [Papaver somniferum]RZC90394.1 hypothetical protein C5167_029537 [Papaver somniferum]
MARNFVSIFSTVFAFAMIIMVSIQIFQWAYTAPKPIGSNNDTIQWVPLGTLLFGSGNKQP